MITVHVCFDFCKWKKKWNCHSHHYMMTITFIYMFLSYFIWKICWKVVWMRYDHVLVNFWENEKSVSETRTVMSGVWANQTFISWMSSLIDVYNQAIGHIIQKIQSFFAYSLIQMLYKLHTCQSTHEKTSSCNKSIYAFSESKKSSITRNH